MATAKELAQELLDFIHESPTAFHGVAAMKKRLDGQGFSELKEGDAWDLLSNGRYYVKKNDSAMIAFIVGKGKVSEHGFKIIGAHTDSPCFRIKPSPEMKAEGGYVKLNVEGYGGAILYSWLDRPLAVAGRVSLLGENPLKPETRLVNIARPIMVIPSLAIHMNREVNKGVELNKQKDMLPLLALVNEGLEEKNLLLTAVAEELKVDASQILDFDLFLYEWEKGSIIGLRDEFISCGRLDNLAMVQAGLEGLLRAEVGQGVNVLAAFDNEEVGSSTKQGGDSQFLSNVLERIVLVTENGGRENFFRALASSFLISADLAHAIHPNYSDKHDPVNRPAINKGPVIKISANQKYTTDSESCGVYEGICRKAGVPVQKFVNRSDAMGGSTIGPISSTHLDIRSVDVGTPILAMHSIRELGGVQDHEYVIRSFETFYSL